MLDRPSCTRAARVALPVLTLVAATAVVAASVSADAATPRPHPFGHTEGFGNNQVLDFFYPQQFFCTADWDDDNDADTRIAAVDPDEFQTPALPPPGSPCIVSNGGTAPPKISPTGAPAAGALKVWAILPLFDGSAVNPAPTSDVQCAEPGPPETQHKGVFSTCTMHPSNLRNGGLPQFTAGDIPTPNHSHIIDGGNFNSIWWKVVVVLVTDRSVWPNAAGTAGITSLTKLRAAQQAGKALPDVPTNFFLFFGSRQFPRSGGTSGSAMAAMPGMDMAGMSH
jgi:hypothetical protein